MGISGKKITAEQLAELLRVRCELRYSIRRAARHMDLNKATVMRHANKAAVTRRAAEAAEAARAKAAKAAVVAVVVVAIEGGDSQKTFDGSR